MNSHNWQAPDDAPDHAPKHEIDNAIINPFKAKSSKDPGSTAVMVCNQDDLKFLCSLTNLDEESWTRFYNSKLYISEPGPGGFSIVGPFIGAPYAVLLLETLIAWGARKIIFFGLCGAVSRDVNIGDLIVPTKSLIDEGTSPAYLKGDIDGVRPSRRLSDRIKAELVKSGIEFHEGMIWSTDAIFRETREKVEFFQKAGVLGVEMETSSMFTVGSFRNVEIAAILVVSDELSTFKWRPGFKEPLFKLKRKAACEVISRLCRTV